MSYMNNPGSAKSTIVKTLLGVLVILLSLSSLASAQNLKIPASPPGDAFIFDPGKVISQSDQQTIAEAQKEAFEKHDTSIVVVVIDRMASYGGNGSVESFAKRWFDTWGIGAQGSNKGILLLVSLEDREARIELGADWTFRWNRHSQSIMDHKIIPKFKNNNYSSGIASGVTALAEMAALDPEATPPGPSWSDSAAHTMVKAQGLSLFEGTTFTALIGVGLALIVAGIFLPDQRKWLIGSGVAVLLVTLFTMVIVAILAIFIRGGGGYSNKGGFSGGFSGGGGASGRW